jgi:3-phosphoshikimate 1-carboxyvinyltransferase
MIRTITPVSNMEGSIVLPGDKSISHRALIFASLADGKSQIHNLSQGKDVMSSKQCLSAMGVEIKWDGSDTVVYGMGLHSLKKPVHRLDAGNSGTTMRLLSGLLAAQTFESTLTGDASLQKRPMERIVTPLRLMGARIEPKEGLLAPLSFKGSRLLNPIDYDSPVASAQVKSCVLLAGLFADGQTSVLEPSLSRDHTERMLPCFQIPVKNTRGRIVVRGPAQLHPSRIDVPGDISSAAFFLVAGALIPKSRITLKNIGVNPTRTGILDVLKSMGADIIISNEIVLNGEPRADIHISGRSLKSFSLENDLVPKLIDEIPVLAIAATQAYGNSLIKHAEELRYKETDRIHAISDNLKAMGISFEELKDGFVIPGPQKLKGAEINTYGDHRIAMAFAVAGLFAKGKTLIQDAQCVDISFPDFFDLLQGLARE